MLICPKRDDYYKNKKIITTNKMGKKIIKFDNIEVEK